MSLLLFPIYLFSQNNVGELHNDIIMSVFEDNPLQGISSPSEKQKILEDFVYKEFSEREYKVSLDIIKTGFDLKDQDDILSFVKENYSFAFYSEIEKDFTYLINNPEIGMHKYFASKVQKIEFEGKEKEMYNILKEVAINSEELWTSKIGYEILGYIGIKNITNRPPRWFKELKELAVQDVGGSLIGGIFGGPVGAAGGGVVASLSCVINNTVN